MISLGPACSKKPAELERPDASRPVPPGTISEDDCRQWSAHGVAVIVLEWTDAAAACTPEVRDGVTDRLKDLRSSILRKTMDACEKHLAEPYSAKDAQCYSAATSVATLRACGFSPMTRPEEADLVTEINGLRKSCAAGPRDASAK